MDITAAYRVSPECLNLTVEGASSTCKLCLMDYQPSEMYSLWSCSCSFCEMCVQQYLSVLIYDGSVLGITCPDGQCPHNGLIEDEEIEGLVEPKIYERYKRMKFLREVEGDPTKAFCPKVGCETVCDVCMDSNSPTPVTCPKDDFMLQHYDKGPCKNRLGHSRASLIWHRTQVVGIFAGFGILLLVASPFLLLAAPCILCCKCKICKCCEDDGEIEGFTSS
ncbi:hypothetical protein LSH36_266g00060 [Paralvinella palmiformis]|uniref:RBR-type E3 ubiquitin transferase n=1 Tax=Paralvinella palmiformis TaxID=53620 RepID=A0AAD9JK79_9ANNE|nr:hypothetical protein LSH36_266g00060 [Paralvinella palmiformis]